LSPADYPTRKSKNKMLVTASRTIQTMQRTMPASRRWASDSKWVMTNNNEKGISILSCREISHKAEHKPPPTEGQTNKLLNHFLLILNVKTT
jgi:hypothetical protein